MSGAPGHWSHLFEVEFSNIDILRANIMKLSELQEDISDMDNRMKAHLNILFHSKTGNLKRGEEYFKSFDEDVNCYYKA